MITCRKTPFPEPFARLRPELERQYKDVVWLPETGMDGQKLSDALAAHREKYPDEPRILTRAWLFHLICTQAQIAIGTDAVFVDKVAHCDLLKKLRDEWKREEEQREFWTQRCMMDDGESKMNGAWGSILDVSHTCADWRSLLTLGFVGLRDRAIAAQAACSSRTSRTEDAEENARLVFYKAVALVYEGVVTLCRRFGELSGADSPVAQLAKRPPETFHEALQLACLYNELQEMEGEPLRSMGRFDVLYKKFYTNDIATGRLTPESARELLSYLWIKYYARTRDFPFGKPFTFGPDANELARLCIDVYRKLNVSDPKFHVRVNKSTPDDFLLQVAKCIKSGSTGIVLVNDTAQVEMMTRNHRSPEDAEDYILIGCYEPAIMGKEMNCSCASVLNLAKAVETVVQTGGDPATFDDWMAAYIKKLDENFTCLADWTRREEKLWPRVNPSPFLSGTMDSCIASGRDVSAAGAKYNMTGCVCVGLANAIDSIAVIKQLVYDEKHCDFEELRSALRDNWRGHEELRLYARNRVPKWGNNNDSIDKVGKQIAAFLAKRINTEPNARSGYFQAALYAIITMAERYGRLTGALPDGRFAGEYLTINTGATQGMEKSGVTALMNSVTKIDLSGFPSGTVLDIMLHPSATSGGEGAGTIASLVRAFFVQGGMAIQFNIFDGEMLRDAKRNPEKYMYLQVRVCGWNVRFVDLSPEEQDIFIAKAESEAAGI
ncbi:MAG: hypothetical protein LBK99_16980 [Opitutaceae bacterium]|jgi:formate C-acetyltransferase|nr:hypothetical protein [Opitutaceae bacterium]